MYYAHLLASSAMILHAITKCLATLAAMQYIPFDSENSAAAFDVKGG
jgi:hypothetical protein